MPHQADKALAATLLKGDDRDFEKFFSEYFPRLYRFALTRLDSEDDAIQDIVQNTLINAMRGMAGYKGEAAMFTWLCQICRNEINGHFRKLNRSVPVVQQDDDSIRPILEALEAEASADPDNQYQGTQLKRIIQEVLDHLPANYGDALEWKYIEGFSVTEIADRMNVTELAAQSTLARARTAFRDTLAKITPQLMAQG